MKNFEQPPQFNPEIPPKPEVDKKKGIERLKEKVIAFAEYKKLKIKEYLGKLNPEEFDKLLSLDFQETLRDTPPIKKVFSPEKELAKIKNLPKGQKREALSEFKETLADQKEALADCRIFIERCVEFDNDAPKEKLMGWVNKFSEQYGFSDEQKKIAEQLIDGYYATRQRVLEAREQYPDNTDLVNQLSGLEFGLEFDKTAKFRVSTGPMSVDITTDSSNANRILKNSKHIVAELFYAGITAQAMDIDMTVALFHGGFAAISEHEKAIPYIVIDRGNFISGPLKRKNVLAHENEHLKNRLFREIFDKQGDLQDEKAILAQYESERDPEIKQELLEEYFLLKRQEAFERAKDEVLAMKKDGASYVYDLFFFQNNSHFDYLAPARDRRDKRHDPLWQETAKKILVKEYQKKFEEALAAFDRLEKEGKYTRDEAIAMLADKSMPEWPKTVKRQLEINLISPV